MSQKLAESAIFTERGFVGLNWNYDLTIVNHKQVIILCDSPSESSLTYKTVSMKTSLTVLLCLLYARRPKLGEIFSNVRLLTNSMNEAEKVNVTDPAMTCRAIFLFSVTATSDFLKPDSTKVRQPGYVKSQKTPHLRKAI